MKITCHRVSKNYCHFEGSIDRWKFVRKIDFELIKACWTTILSKSRQKFILITFSTFYQFHLVAVVHVRLATDHYGQKKRPLAIAVPPRREMHLNIQCILSRLICSATLRLIEWGVAQSSSVHVWARVPIPAACILLDAVQFKTASGHFARVREFTRAARTCTMGRGSLTNSSSRGISLPMKFSSHSTLLIFPGDDLIEPPSSLIRKLNREKHLSRVLFYGIYLVMGMTTG